MLSADAEVSNKLSYENATAQIISVCLLNFYTSWFVVEFHSLIVLSADAEVSNELSYKNATALTSSVCLLSFCTS